MKKCNVLAIAGGILLGSIAISQASIVISTFAGTLQNAGGTTIPAGTMLQLINLGADGVFNQINLADGSTSSLTQWVSGDDSVIDAAFGNADSATFSTAKAFDLSEGSDPVNGQLTRDFTFDITAVPQNTKIGVRWFPGLNAGTVSSGFASFILNSGQSYGQFTRQSNPQHNGDLWVAPADGIQISADSLATTDIAGNDPITAGRATQTVIPEPGTASLAILGLAALCGTRRRKE